MDIYELHDCACECGGCLFFHGYNPFPMRDSDDTEYIKYGKWTIWVRPVEHLNEVGHWLLARLDGFQEKLPVPQPGRWWSQAAKPSDKGGVTCVGGSPRHKARKAAIRAAKASARLIRLDA